METEEEWEKDIEREWESRQNGGESFFLSEWTEVSKAGKPRQHGVVLVFFKKKKKNLEYHMNTYNILILIYEFFYIIIIIIFEYINLIYFI